MDTALDLFSGLGGFSAAFKESDDWNVTTVDRESVFNPDIRADILSLYPDDLPNADVILASPPCTYFSTAGNHDSWNGSRPVGEAKEHVALVFHTIGLIEALAPRYWFLENPRGRLRWFLGKPTGTVTYCQYGKPYQKPTDLWGEHPDGFTYRNCPNGGDCHESNTEDDGTSAVASMDGDKPERAKVPYELSESILTAVEGRQKQRTIGETYG